MSKQNRLSERVYGPVPSNVDGFDALAEIALNMQWSWNHAGDELWRELDAVLWEITHNPWAVLQTASRDKIERVLADPVYRKRVDELVQKSRRAQDAPAWFQQKHSNEPLPSVAYFSMEYMLSEALPIYSGGLGNVAGDQLKAASDLGVPVVELLEQQVVPQFYSRDKSGIPGAGIKRIRESMARLTPRFSADRAVRQYTELRYLPAVAEYVSRQNNKGEMGRSTVDWRRHMEQKWNAIRLGTMKVHTRGSQHLFEVQVHTEDLDPSFLRVEPYANGVNGSAPVTLEMKQAGALKGTACGYAYTAQVSSGRPRGDYMVRAIPYLSGACVPLESHHVLWQK